MLRARAKINLGLTVIGRRPDGFHDVESVMQQISLSDTLLFEPQPGKGFVFESTDPDLAGPENLICRSAALLEEKTGQPLPGVKVTLHKNIPVSAGLAGGSSDAAAALLGLNKFLQTKLGRPELLELACRLGSDVPFCLQGGTFLARGRGEKLKRLPALPFFWVVLALPRGVQISTAAAYGSFDRRLLGKPDLKPLVAAIKRGRRNDITAWLSGGFTNTLETAKLPGSEQVANLKSLLRDCGLKPVYSGSGPALFMVLENYNDARSAAGAVENRGGKSFLCWTTGTNKEWLNV